MRLTIRVVRLSLLLLVAASLCSCAARQKQVTSLPQGVTQQQVQSWDTAVANLHKLATITSTARKLVIQLNQTTYLDHSTGKQEPVFPDGPAYAKFLQGLAKVDQAQIEAAKFLQTVPQNWNLSVQGKMQGYTTAIGSTLQDLVNNGLVGIKNSTSQKEASNLISDMQSTLNIILALYQ